VPARGKGVSVLYRTRTVVLNIGVSGPGALPRLVPGDAAIAIGLPDGRLPRPLHGPPTHPDLVAPSKIRRKSTQPVTIPNQVVGG